jgi:type I restriction enzyme, S subunit
MLSVKLYRVKSEAIISAPSCTNFEYLPFLSLKSPYFYNEMRAGMTGVAITRVTLNKLDDAIVSIPPLNEQHRIVAKFDELMVLQNQRGQTRLIYQKQQRYHHTTRTE